ncbi:MAG: Amicyanin-alpha [Rhodocyclaceae bacterium]|nr:MAG: plastocyanin [Rhodocyclaceae bacterium]MBE7421228.1 cupredoxin domain-containing protein [Zoogloeaceae bacterium]CAG0944816.1 plastocyanin [Gammaproteobacteria bacterium]MBV6407728.1 Amicyanin-alpha [Rhodocyclaceae bacterium]MCC6879804.1 cupredoxin domain-containing protein [Rhodocyclaceae bacterium]
MKAGSIAVLWGLTFLVAQAAAQTVEVSIRDYKFVPAELKIKAGTTVKWINEEKRTTHSVLFTGPGGIESERFFPGESWQRTFDKPGVHPYTCGPHPEMKGTVEVTQ